MLDLEYDVFFKEAYIFCPNCRARILMNAALVEWDSVKNPQIIKCFTCNWFKWGTYLLNGMFRMT